VFSVYSPRSGVCGPISALVLIRYPSYWLRHDLMNATHAATSSSYRTRLLYGVLAQMEESFCFAQLLNVHFKMMSFWRLRRCFTFTVCLSHFYLLYEYIWTIERDLLFIIKINFEVCNVLFLPPTRCALFVITLNYNW